MTRSQSLVVCPTDTASISVHVSLTWQKLLTLQTWLIDVRCRLCHWTLLLRWPDDDLSLGMAGRTESKRLRGLQAAELPSQKMLLSEALWS